MFEFDEGSKSLNEMWVRLIDLLMESAPDAPENMSKNIEMATQARRMFFGGAVAAFTLIERGCRENVMRDIEAFFKDEDLGEE